MKNIISLCIFLINIISYTNAQYGNTTNNCFYANSRDVFRGTVATAIQINGANLNEFLSTCCDYCRILPTEWRLSMHLYLPLLRSTSFDRFQA